PDDLYHFFQLANASRGGPMHAPEGPVVREADQEPSRHGRGRHLELSPTRERREPLGEAFREYGRAPGVRAREAGRIERRMHDHPQGQRKDIGKVLPKTNDDGVQVRERVLRGVLGPEQLLEVRSPWAHRREEELVLAAEALIEDGFGDAGGVRDL